MSFLSTLASLGFVGAVLRSAAPIGLAALGGTLSERSGVPNIALEGVMLSSALASVAVHATTGSPLIGLLAGVATGALVGAVHAGLVVRARIDAIVSGLAINLVAAGGTRALLRVLYHSSSNSPTVSGFRLAALEGSSGGALLVRVLADPTIWLFVFATLLLRFVLERSWVGPWIRASGDDPVAAHASGVPVRNVRTLATILGCASVGLGGVSLAFEQHQFQSGMTGGRGFIALAAVIVAGWRPGRAVAACVAFAVLDAVGVVLQDGGGSLPQVFSALPYLGTLLVLVLFAKRGSFGAPAGLGKDPNDG
jgi:simple sugar transport system permease protein